MCDAYEPPKVGEDGKDDVPLKAIPTNSRASCAEVSTCIMLRLAGSAASSALGRWRLQGLGAEPLLSWTHGSKPLALCGDTPGCCLKRECVAHVSA